MMPRSQRLSRDRFTLLLSSKQLRTVYNELGTLKYEPSNQTALSVVTSGRHEKSAVRRNKLRRRIYAITGREQPALFGVVYASKQSYGFEYEKIERLTLALLEKSKAHP